MRAGNTITQRSWRTSGVRQEQRSRSLFYNHNEQETTGAAVSARYIWFRSYWDLNGMNQYSYSLDGQSFIDPGEKSQMTWGSYRGDRIGIINFNSIADTGYIDVDYFNYQYHSN